MKYTIILLMMLMFPFRVHSAEGLDEAVLHYGRGEYRQTINILRQLSRSDPDDPVIRYWLGKSHLRINEWDAAVREFEKAVRLEPAKAYYRLWLGRAAGAMADNSVFFRAVGWARRVISEFEKARDLEPENTDVRFDLLEFYVQAPGIVGGGKNKAETEARIIAELAPSKGYIARAIIHERNNNWDKARKELTQATVDFPEIIHTHLDLADFLLRRNDFKEALKHGEKALELDFQSKRARLIVAVAEIRLQGDLDRAITMLQRLAAGELYDGDPSFEEVYYYLGEGYLAKGEKSKAREAMNSALIFNPGYARAKNALSKIN
ncbi:MAG TPA: tetratricopeptide repeat protein [Acidobacteriota bacterium]|nr:tetratricopeptide repeat protein [Acidobacteriota bacterium]